MLRRINGFCASPIACLVLGVLFLASSSFSSDIAESIGTSSFDPVTQQEVFEVPGSARSAPGVVASATASYLNITKRGSTWIGEKTPNHLVLDNGIAYVAGSYSGLLIYDVSDPLNPVEIAENHIPRYAVDVYKDGSMLAIADTYLGVHLFDVTDPYSPSLIHTVPVTGSKVRSVALAGNALYVAAEQGGLQTFDISIPTSPVLTNTIPAENLIVSQVAVVGSNAYVAVDYNWRTSTPIASEFWVLDLSTPTQPSVAGELVLPGFVQFFDITVDNNTAYLPGAQDGVYLVDVTDPAQPDLQAIIPRDVDIYQAPKSVVVDNNTLYVGSSPHIKLHMYDVSDPGAPVELGYYNDEAFGTVALDAAVMGDHAVVCTGPGGLQLLDIQDPANLSQVSRNTVRGSAYDLEAKGDYLYVANGTEFSTVDISNPDAMAETSTLPASVLIEDVAVVDEFSFYTDNHARVSKASLLNPAAPEFLMGKSTQAGAKGVAASGDYVFVADWNAGLSVYNFAYQPNPILVANLPLEGYADAILLDGNRLYVGSGNVRLYVIDVSDPTAPAILGSLAMAAKKFKLNAAGYLVVAGALNDQPGLFVVDVSDPTAPAIIGDYYRGYHHSYVHNVAVRDNLAFFAAESQIDIIDLSDPTMPMQAGVINTTYLARAVAVNGDQVYIGMGGELQAYDVTENGTACGDIDHSGGEPDVGDLTFLIGYLFLDGTRPVPSAAGDVDGVAGTDVGDVTKLVEFMFLDGPALSCQ